MERRFLGQGWRFPIRPDAAGRLGYTSDEENIEQSLRILLQTVPGERAMRFDFGCRASQLVFAPGGERYFRLLESSIRDAVRDWEPRVEVIDVLVEADPEEPQEVTVSLEYSIRASDTRGNLVFPLYLESLEVE